MNMGIRFTSLAYFADSHAHNTLAHIPFNIIVAYSRYVYGHPRSISAFFLLFHMLLAALKSARIWLSH